MSTLSVDPVTPDPADIDRAHEALPHIKAYLARHHTQETVRLVDDDETLEPATTSASSTATQDPAAVSD